MVERVSATETEDGHLEALCNLVTQLHKHPYKDCIFMAPTLFRKATWCSLKSRLFFFLWRPIGNGLTLSWPLAVPWMLSGWWIWDFLISSRPLHLQHTEISQEEIRSGMYFPSSESQEPGSKGGQEQAMEKEDSHQSASHQSSACPLSSQHASLPQAFSLLLGDAHL